MKLECRKELAALEVATQQAGFKIPSITVEGAGHRWAETRLYCRGQRKSQFIAVGAVTIGPSIPLTIHPSTITLPWSLPG